MLTIFSNWFGCVVEGSAVLSININLLWVVITWLELWHKLHAINKMSWPFCDASDTCCKQLLRSTFLDKWVSATNWTWNWCWWVHCTHNSHVTATVSTPTLTTQWQSSQVPGKVANTYQGMDMTHTHNSTILCYTKLPKSMSSHYKKKHSQMKVHSNGNGTCQFLSK